MYCLTWRKGWGVGGGWHGLSAFNIERLSLIPTAMHSYGYSLESFIKK